MLKRRKRAIPLIPKHTYLKLGFILLLALNQAFDAVMETVMGHNPSSFQLLVEMGISVVCMFLDNPDQIRINSWIHLIILFVLNLLFLSRDTVTEEIQGFCPMDSAGFHSQVFISWFTSIVINGKNKTLILEDLPELPKNTDSQLLNRKWTKAWAREVKRCSQSNDAPSIARIVYSIFWKSTLSGAIVRLLADILVFSSPVLLMLLIDFVSTPLAPLSFGVICALSLFLIAELRSFLINNYAFINMKNSVWFQSMISNAIYLKILRLSPASRGKHTIGELVNFMSVDVEKIVAYMPFLVETFTAPLDIFLYMLLLFIIMGLTSLGGILIMVLCIPLNYHASRYIKNQQLKQMRVKDERTKISNEMLNGIKLIKLYAWEEAFEKRINQLRDKEVEILRQVNLAARVVDAANTCAPYIATVATFALFVLSSNENVLTPQIAFVALTIFNQIKYPMRYFSTLLNYLVQALVSKKRIEKFLCEEELDSAEVPEASNGMAVEIRSASFSWGDQKAPPTLQDISLSIKQGEFVAIVGAVGTGKSSFLSAILGELTTLSGSVSRTGSTAYCLQQSWLQNATVRENILFGKPYDRRHFKRVIEAVELTKDLELLENGELTLVGENGLMLSGGQKARIALARALYQDNDVYLLDDCLSAVDAHVGASVFSKALSNHGFLRNKTRIFVTHGLHYTRDCDKIIVMLNGTIHRIGTYDELLYDDIFTKMLHDIESEKKKKHEEESDDEDPEEKQIKKRQASFANRSLSLADSLNLQEGEQIGERVESGKVSWTVYLSYVKAATISWSILLLASYFISCGFGISRALWLSAWTDDNIDGVITGDTNYQLFIFTVLAFLEIGFLVAAQFALVFGCQSASLRLHSPLLASILRSPMSFFDMTPVGRIVNRLSRDLEVIDSLLPTNIGSATNCAMQVLLVLIMISISTPLFLATIIPLGLLYVIILRYFIGCARQFKRIESAQRSPIISLFGETAQGASTIRAYKKVDASCLSFTTHVDRFARCKFCTFSGNRWIGLRLELLGNSVSLIASVLGIISTRIWDLSPAMVGLSISYALTITDMLYFGVRCMTELETYIVSVERVQEYSKLPAEREWHSPMPPPETWPDKGKIEWRHYSTRYRNDLPLVVKELSAKMRSGEKVAIIGRTGSGKSSLTLALYRMIEGDAGRIFIDGIDISTIGLHDLRKKLTIIPQEPVLFSGTIRFNLDPFDQHSDEEIWNALEACQLKPYIAALNGELEYNITEGGQNMSVGQRQLVCLGRALLQKGKILILDEATAACDAQTDACVQRVIRTDFAESTVIAIAHRLNTIADYDRIMVLDSGRLSEFDSPYRLLNNPNSIYTQMVAKTKRNH
ncbi:unnamed protein product, partial [Mesorhabditis belari]|uniref:ABC-type glutathione-S-conjugate transporter n=1 Tax=Mesorhabditis belari TaxID=2138241 RepID=A0AAF3ETV8_9BILA